MHVETIRVNWKWFFGFGLVSALLGVMAIGVPTLFTKVTHIFLGVALIGSGLFQGVHALRVHRAKGFFPAMFSAVLQVGFGIWMAFFPITPDTIFLLGLLLGMLFAFEGLFKAYWGFHIKPDSTWPWLVGNGVASLVFAVLIGFRVFGPELQALGLLVGLNLLANGLILIVIGTMNRMPVPGGGEVKVPIPATDDEESEAPAPAPPESA